MDAVDMDTEEDSHDDTIEETEVCRVCLLGHMIMRDLFVENNVTSLSAKAMSFASVKMVPEDGLPAQVCCNCADKLEAAYEFKLQVEQADNILRQRYDGLNIKEELFFNEVEVHLEAERGDDVHSLNVDVHYQATVDSLNSVDTDSQKSSLLKDHLALLEVEKLSKQQSTLTEHKQDEVLDEENGVSAMLEANDGHSHYLDESEGTVVELGDCNNVDYRETVKAQGIHDSDGITAEEHNYIMQQGYTLTRNEGEELVSQESVDSVNNETVNYLALMEDEMRAKEMHRQEETLNTVESEQQEQERIKKTEISPNETRRSKRRLSKRNCTNDEDNYFENLNLSSRLKRTQSQEKSEKTYFLCYLCDKRFLSKEILKEHMHLHEEVRRALSLKKQEKSDKSMTSPTKNPVPSTSTTPPITGNNLSGKKANKCPYCGKEYLYVISFNKHLRQHEKNKGFNSKDSSFSHEDSGRDDAKDSSDYLDYDETRESPDINNHMNTNENDTSIVDEDLDDEFHFGMETTHGNPSPKKHRRRSMRNETVSYPCEKCNQSFANKRSLLEHSSIHFAIFKCSTCEREFDELEKLRKHRTEHVVEGVLSQQDLEDNVYENEFDARSHENDPNEIYKNNDFEENQLESCDHQEEDEDDDQENNIDTENSWNLEVEGEEDDHEDDDMREMSVNWRDGKNYKCPHCTITCSSKKSLIRHVEYHEGATQRICKLCKAEFASKEELQQHVEQEYACKTKIFKCTDCSKIFGNELTLRNHLFATNHKTILHGEPYDPNKRIKRVAAKAAQKIIDKIKTEGDFEDSEEDEKSTNSEYQEENPDLSDSKMNNVRWNHRQDVKIDDMTSPKKTQTQRNNRRGHNYECETCGRKCRSKQSLTKHMLQHPVKDEKIDTAENLETLRRNNLTQMSERSGPFTNQQQINRTMNFKGEERTEDEEENDDNSDFESGLDWPVDSHECPTCKKKYSTKKSLLRHQLLHQKPNFECDICNVKFYRKDKLKSHYDKCSEKNPDQVRKCNICGDTFENNDILKEHRSRHVDEGILTEEDLREIEPGMDERKESTKIARKRRTDIVGLECTECNKRYTSRKGLLRHIQVHEGKKYLCDICPKKFYRREHLKIHVAKHNMIKPYKCPRCTKRFIKEEQLSSHLSKHDRTFKKPKETDTSKRFLCEICSKSFTQSTTLIAHLRAHNGIKPYVCEVCARPFTTNAYLKMHMRTHTQERPYTCQHCSRAFARADTLANHLTSHTGEAKYHCKYCPKNFRRLKSLKEHVFIHTGQRPYACPTCDRRFNNNGSRYAHSKRCKQNHLLNSNRPSNANAIGTPMLQENIVHNQLVQPIRLHQLTTTHELISEHDEQTQIQLVKSQNIKTITIARTTDDLNGTQMMQHQEILMPLILPLTVTLTDPDEEVILPEGTKIYTTA
ncbi:zinc finger protein 91-like [Venturia canescens]|uniref:zinc finger protein 91-like n=1 Tax=Venturia canescens TaxID=32260 RepID=UPI001C9D4EC2|nr:zinc finger protein 91-like [Venturia canescens]